MILAISLMIADVHYSERMSSWHQLGDRLNFWVHKIIYNPKFYIQDVISSLSSIEKLQRENGRLRQENLRFQGELYKLGSLEIENEQLRQLLNSAPKEKDDFIVANIAAVNIEPYQRQLILDKGLSDSIIKGQVVTDASGVVGSVIQTTTDASRILLLTDVNHAIPVESLRSGVRSILVGASNDDFVMLQHLPNTTDIKEGDIFVTSGIGGKYPFGYPVAKVTYVEQDPANPFSIVKLKPLANLGTNRQVLVLRRQGTGSSV
jgi:rod shape-determining protein MreC